MKSTKIQDVRLEEDRFKYLQITIYFLATILRTHEYGFYYVCLSLKDVKVVEKEDHKEIQISEEFLFKASHNKSRGFLSNVVQASNIIFSNNKESILTKELFSECSALFRIILQATRDEKNHLFHGAEVFFKVEFLLAVTLLELVGKLQDLQKLDSEQQTNTIIYFFNFWKSEDKGNLKESINRAFESVNRNLSDSSESIGLISNNSTSEPSAPTQQNPRP